MSEPRQSIRSGYHSERVLHDGDECRSVIAVTEAGDRVVIHDVTFNADTPTAVRMRLEHETASLALLSLDGMVVPLDFEINDGWARIICPLPEGRCLSECIAAAKLTIDDVLSIADDVLGALAELHAHGLVRRCLRPDEIFVQESNGRLHATIGGFGPLMMLQGLRDDDFARRFALYASPEALGALEEDVRPAADLYSLGIVLFECLTGRTPFQATLAGDLVFHHMTSPVPDLTTITPGIPRAFSDIIRRMLEKHPRDRYQSASGVRYDIQRLYEICHAADSETLVLGTMDCRETLIEPAFVGRSHDLSLLESELDAVALGNSRVVLITAGSGMGKSRLLLEASRMAASRCCRVFRARGRNQLGLAPLASLQSILADCMHVIRQDAQLRDQLQRELAEFARELQTVLPELVELLQLNVPTERTDELSDRRIAIALATLLGSMGSCGRPVLLLLDDMQWADDLTLIMLECWHLINARKTLLIVGSRSADVVGERLQENLKTASRISLDPLERHELDQLLGSMAGGLPSTILTTVWEMSSGNPFVASAVLRGLVEGGVLTPSQSGWVVDADRLRNLQTSGEAAEILKQRLFRLPASSQNLLAVGSVLGKEFSIEMAAEVAGIPREHVLQLLTEPRRNHLIWERANGSLCSFMHDQIRESILESLQPARRAEIHFKAATYLQRNAAHSIFDIAFHFDAAGRSDLARVYAVEAAEHARSSHALETAEQQYRIALRSCTQHNDEPDFQILHGLGDVLMLSGRYQEAQPLFERAVQKADSRATRAAVTLKLGELAFKEDQKDRAIELWESALRSLGGTLPGPWMTPLWTLREIAVQTLHSLMPRYFLATRVDEPTLDDRLLWRLHSRLAYAYWFVRSKLDVLHVHLRGMNLAERYKPTAELAQAYSEHAPAMSLIPLSRRGIAYGRRSLKIRSEQNDIWGQGQSLHFLAIALYSAAQFEECVDVGRRSVRILERAGDFWEKHIAQYQVAASLYRLGRMTEAAQLSREAYDSGLAVGDYQVCGNIIDVWSRATNGDVPVRILQRELERPRADVQGQAHVLLAQGVHLISEHRFDDAVAALDQAIVAAKKAGIANTYTSPLLAWKATALRCQLEQRSPLTRGLRRRLLQNHRRTARQALLVAMRFRNELPHALREYAWGQVFQNHNLRAIWLLKSSLRIARRQSAEYEVIQSELLLQKLRLELGCKRADKALENAERRAAVFRNEQLPQRMLSSLSLVDRFDSLLESGRKVASAMTPAEIAQTTKDAARRLLRSNHSEIIDIDENGIPATHCETLRLHIFSALKAMDAVSATGTGSDFRSLLTCPIIVRGRVTACLVAGNSELRDLFGPNELRIARYIATIAGAALENAEGFRNLQELNANLEQIVDDRTAVVKARSQELQQTADHLRQVQKQLAAARDAAESASRAKTDFLASMSHEIRTPIGAVLGFTELLLHGDAPLLPEQTAHLQRVLSNGNHLHHLLNDLLDLSRIEAGRLSIEPMECNPFALIHDILSALQSKAMSKGLTLCLRANNPVPERIQTDPTRLRQILNNLIGNAIKFTAEGSVELAIQTDVARQTLSVAVRDSGVGIEPAAHQRIFEPFQQANTTVVRRFGGTGLGLSISRKLAQALGGDIELTSEPGFGSTFTVTISTGDLTHVQMLSTAEAEAKVKNPVATTVPDVDLQDRCILIADDVEANREYFAHVLRRAGASCTLACDGRQAVSLCQSNSFDLVLMDMQMPVLDGYQATRALRDSGFMQPIVAITANGTREDQQNCEAAGCSGYLTKPISIGSLLSGVAEMLGLAVDAASHNDSVTQTDTSLTTLECHHVSHTREPGKTSMQSSTTRVPDPLNDTALPADPVFRDFAVRFLAKVEEALPDMTAAVDSSAASRLAELAHWMKGTGGMVGLPQLTQLGSQLETAAHAEDFPLARRVVTEISQIVQRLQSCSTVMLNQCSAE